MSKHNITPDGHEVFYSPCTFWAFNNDYYYYWIVPGTAI